MEMKFSVHNPHMSPVTIEAQVQGEPVQATVDIFECELMSLDGRSGTLKFRSAPDARAVFRAREIFQADAIITATFIREEKPADWNAESNIVETIASDGSAA